MGLQPHEYPPTHFSRNKVRDEAALKFRLGLIEYPVDFSARTRRNHFPQADLAGSISRKSVSGA